MFSPNWHSSSANLNCYYNFDAQSNWVKRFLRRNIVWPVAVDVCMYVYCSTLFVRDGNREGKGNECKEISRGKVGSQNRFSWSFETVESVHEVTQIILWRCSTPRNKPATVYWERFARVRTIVPKLGVHTFRFSDISHRLLDNGATFLHDDVSMKLNTQLAPQFCFVKKLDRLWQTCLQTFLHESITTHATSATMFLRENVLI